MILIMKEKLIRYIEAYAAAKISKNEILIAYAVEKLNEIILEVFGDDNDPE